MAGLDPLFFTTVGDPQHTVGVVGQQLAALGYAVTPGPDGWSGAAEVGSAVGRALGGGFVRRMKLTYSVTQGQADGQWSLVVAPAMSGASGGALGMSKAKKEMASVAEAIGAGLQAGGHVMPPPA